MSFRDLNVFSLSRHPLVKEEPAKPKSDVELPPAVSSLGYLLEEENLYKDGQVVLFVI